MLDLTLGGNLSTNVGYPFGQGLLSEENITIGPRHESDKLADYTPVSAIENSAHLSTA